MTDLTLFGGLIGFIIGLILFTVFLIMGSNIGDIRRKISILSDELKKNRESLGTKIYRCKNCGYQSVQKTDFCPVCKKNNEGKTLSNLIKDYEELEKKKSEKPKFRL